MNAVKQAALTRVSRGKGAQRRRPRSDLRAALIFIAPATFGFVAFYLWPALRGFYYSFTDFNIFNTPEIVGLDNYERLWTDSKFHNAVIVTLEYVLLNIGAQTVLAILLAVLMQRLTKSVVIRGVVLLPYLIANVVVALVWYWMLDYQLGIVNVMMGWVGIDPVAFFGSETWAIPTVAFVNVWRHLGYTALLIFAGLQTIPPQIYEAAAIDGAGEVYAFRKITMPLLRPVLALVLVITVTGSFQVFDTVAVTTDGGPANATRVIYHYIWDLAFNRNDFGYASAMSVALLVVLSGIAFAQLKLMRANSSDLA